MGAGCSLPWVSSRSNLRWLQLAPDCEKSLNIKFHEASPASPAESVTSKGLMPSTALHELGSQRQVLAALLIVEVVTPYRETKLAHFLHTVWQALAMMVQMEVSTTKYLLVDLPGKHPPPSCHCPPLLPGLHACPAQSSRAVPPLLAQTTRSRW